VNRSSERQTGASLEEVNAELRKSLEHCRELLAECRSKLANNSDEPAAENVAEGETPGTRS
jgi:hypothetical protein